MSYTITKTNGVTIGTIADGTIDTASTSLTLVGRNYSNYGQFMVDNFVRLLENFAYNISPSNPVTGQIWWDTGNNQLKVYNGTFFKVISSATAAAVAPSTTLAGDIWWDTSNEQLYVYNGTTPYNILGWILVGPSWSKLNGKSGAIWEQISDTNLTVHNVISLYLDGVRTGIISDDVEFTPLVTIAGFTSIKPGYNMFSTGTFWGTANNASYLGGVAAANYLRTDTNNTSTGELNITNDQGITIGAGSDVEISVTGGINGQIINRTSTGNLDFYANVSGTLTRSIHINGTSGVIEVDTDPTTTLGIATKGYVDDKFNNAALTGVSTAITAPAGTANTMIATTSFVINNSGFLKNKIYDSNNTFLEVVDTGSGFANLAIDGVSVLTASASGVTLRNGATATTQSQTYNGVGNSTVATTAYAKTATTWWSGSAKFVSTDAPIAGVNDNGSNDGDIWFQRAV